MILAGISIATLTGENGILGKASTAKIETIKKSAEEKVQIAVMGSYTTDGSIDLKDLNTNIRQIEGLTKIICGEKEIGEKESISELPIQVVVDGYTFEIDVNGKITRKPEKPKVTHTTTPSQETILAEGTKVIITITATTTEGTISKIIDPDGNSTDNVNTITYEVRKNGAYKFIVEGSNGETTTYIVKVMNIGNTEIFSDIYTETQTYQDKNGKTARIPEGFAVGESSTIDTIENGLVITDQIDEFHRSTGNEFVWIPVNSPSEFKRINGYSDLINVSTVLKNVSEPYSSGSKEEKDTYDSMNKSVMNELNKGFYIGRYEAGKENNKVVVKKNKTVYYDVYWGKSMTNLTGGAVELAKNFINDKKYKDKVTTTLCYGIQWDTTLTFFKNEAYLKNYRSKGNDGGSLIATGSNENYKVKNVYDMAGNAWEWTMEANGTGYRNMRGGRTFVFNYWLWCYLPTFKRPRCCSIWTWFGWWESWFQNYYVYKCLESFALFNECLLLKKALNILVLIKLTNFNKLKIPSFV